MQPKDNSVLTQTGKNNDCGTAAICKQNDGKLIIECHPDDPGATLIATGGYSAPAIGGTFSGGHFVDTHTNTKESVKDIEIRSGHITAYGGPSGAGIGGGFNSVAPDAAPVFTLKINSKTTRLIYSLNDTAATARVTVNGVAVNTASGKSVTVDLAGGTNTIVITVTSDCSHVKRTYTVNAENSFYDFVPLFGIKKPGTDNDDIPKQTPVTEPVNNNTDKKRENPFTDVKADDWFLDDVLYVYKKGIMRGVSDKLFDPDGNATRAMIATTLWRMAASPKADTQSRFNVIDEKMYYAEAVAWAGENNIIVGYDDGLFHPDTAITREQLVTSLFRFAQYLKIDVSGLADISAFSDYKKVSDWAENAVRWAVSSSLVNGRENGEIDPSGTATRAEIAAILHRFEVKFPTTNN